MSVTQVTISIGPVQGFVAAARRTRDFWGGSYLLSWLAARAIVAAQNAGGTLVRPSVPPDEPMLLWAAGRPSHAGQVAPRMGSIPNVFTVAVSEQELAAGVAKAAEEAFRQAWHQIAAAVSQHLFGAAVPTEPEVRAIWERQIANFWEFSWVVGRPEDVGGALARRKLYRVQVAPGEAGDKCSIMPEWQELSGICSTTGPAANARQKEFWNRIRRRVGSFDLSADERLCAIALIKRVFVKVSESALGFTIEAGHWPSTQYIAALPWIEKVLETAPELAARFAESAIGVYESEAVAEHRPQFAAFKDVSRGLGGRFRNLDARCFDAQKLKDLAQATTDEGGETAHIEELLAELRELRRTPTAEGRPLGGPSGHYAWLLSDGDHMGRAVAAQGPGRVGEALARFLKRVPAIVEGHNGVVIYAGGDDVLAMMPVEESLRCADDLAQAWMAAFEEDPVFRGNPDAPTLSSGLVLAHARYPMGLVALEAHRLLDEVAKAENGRNSLAIGLLKRGGLTAQWATTWTRSDDPGHRAVDRFLRLAEALREGQREVGLSTSLLYRLRELLVKAGEESSWRPGLAVELPRDLDLEELLAAEVSESLEARGEADPHARAQAFAQQLSEILRPACAREQNNSADLVALDGLMIARFLVAPSREEA